jgi:hypothetical protein
MDKRALIEALNEVLKNEEAAEAMVNTSRAVNEEIEQTDLMRRTGIKPDVYKEGRANEGEVFVATDKFVAGVAANIIASEAFQTLQRQIAELQKKSEKLTEIERDNAILRARITELERDDDQKLERKLNDRPANRVRYIDLPDAAIVPATARGKAVVGNDEQRFNEVQAMSQVDSLMARLEKMTRGGK